MLCGAGVSLEEVADIVEGRRKICGAGGQYIHTPSGVKDKQSSTKEKGRFIWTGKRKEAT